MAHACILQHDDEKKSLYLLGTKKEDKREWKLGKILSQFNLYCMKAATNEYYTLDLTFLAYSTIALFHVYLSWNTEYILAGFTSTKNKNVHDELNIFSLKAVYILVTEWYVPEREKYLEICDARSSQQTYI